MSMIYHGFEDICEMRVSVVAGYTRYLNFTL